MNIQMTNRNFIIVNYYCPNNVNLNIQNINVKSENFIIVGDFDSHSQSWGYSHIDNPGEEIEDWQDENNLTLINRPNDAHVYPTIAVKTISAPVLPRWNYKKTNWLLYHYRTSVLTKNIHIYDRDINKVVSEFTICILQAVKEAIPKGARKEYKPYWNNDLAKLHN